MIRSADLPRLAVSSLPDHSSFFIFLQIRSNGEAIKRIFRILLVPEQLSGDRGGVDHIEAQACRAGQGRRELPAPSFICRLKTTQPGVGKELFARLR